MTLGGRLTLAIPDGTDPPVAPIHPPRLAVAAVLRVQPGEYME